LEEPGDFAMDKNIVTRCQYINIIALQNQRNWVRFGLHRLGSKNSPPRSLNVVVLLRVLMLNLFLMFRSRSLRPFPVVIEVILTQREARKRTRRTARALLGGKYPPRLSASISRLEFQYDV
jgi:hypothetical protein